MHNFYKQLDSSDKFVSYWKRELKTNAFPLGPNHIRTDESHEHIKTELIKSPSGRVLSNRFQPSNLEVEIYVVMNIDDSELIGINRQSRSNYTISTMMDVNLRLVDELSTKLKVEIDDMIIDYDSSGHEASLTYTIKIDLRHDGYYNVWRNRYINRERLEYIRKKSNSKYNSLVDKKVEEYNELPEFKTRLKLLEIEEEALDSKIREYEFSEMDKEDLNPLYSSRHDTQLKISDIDAVIRNKASGDYLNYFTSRNSRMSAVEHMRLIDTNWSNS